MSGDLAQPPPRAYRVIRQPAERGFDEFLWICSILLWFMIICCPVIALVTLWLPHTSVAPNQYGAILTIAASAAVLCTSPLVMRMQRVLWRKYVARFRARSRLERLNRITAHPNSRDRLPHRHIEKLLLDSLVAPGTTDPSKYLFTSVPTVPPGTCVLLRTTKPSWRHWLRRFDTATQPSWPNPPRRSDIPFEPVGVADKDALTSLVELQYDRLDQADSNGVLPEARTMIQSHASPPSTLALVGIAALIVVAASFIGGTTGPVLLTVFLLEVVIIVMILCRRGRWWIVPGGLVCRRGPLGSQKTVELLTHENASLIVPNRSGSVTVLKDSDILKFSASSLASWCILAGWISTARTPTLKEVRTLLDPECDDAGGASEAPPTERVE